MLSPTNTTRWIPCSGWPSTAAAAPEPASSDKNARALSDEARMNEPGKQAWSEILIGPVHLRASEPAHGRGEGAGGRTGNLAGGRLDCGAGILIGRRGAAGILLEDSQAIARLEERRIGREGLLVGLACRIELAFREVGDREPCVADSRPGDRRRPPPEVARLFGFAQVQVQGRNAVEDIPGRSLRRIGPLQDLGRRAGPAAGKPLGHDLIELTQVLPGGSWRRAKPLLNLNPRRVGLGQ